MTIEILIISGSRAKKALTQGATDPQFLRTLGFCRNVQFDHIGEREAFKEGFELALKLEDPVIHDRS